MESRAKLFGHPIHQMLVVFPLGLLATGVLFDLIFIANGRPMMAAVAYWMIAAGVIGGLLAAPFGWIDWTGIPSGTDPDALLGAMKLDKKNLGGRLRLILWRGVGLAEIVSDVAEADVRAVLAEG